MRKKTNQMFYLLTRIFIVVLICNAIATAQESTPPEEFPIGTEFGNQTIGNTIFYDPFYESGMNTISQRADNITTWEFINNYNVLASNNQNKEDWICHYSTCYYSKWEAEQNQTIPERVGVKHSKGQPAYWNDGSDSFLCWSTKGLSAPDDSLMYGPHYRQDTRYKRWLYDWQNRYNVNYVPRFRMALSKAPGVTGSEEVCEIKVVYRYKVSYSATSSEFFDSVFMRRTLKVEDFDTNGNFSDFHLDDDTIWYKYPVEFILPERLENFVNPQPDQYPDTTDSESYTGIQFCVDWLRSDTLCTLFIDYIEVYDNNGWNDFIDDPGGTAYKITSYVDSFKTLGWNNIKYWIGQDEPYSIDAYTPIRVVDSLIRLVNPSAPLMTSFNPMWTWDHKINGEFEIEQYINRVDPQKFLLAVNPCDQEYLDLTFTQIDWLRHNLQLTHSLHPNFWFAAQAHGRRWPNGNWNIWRKPIPVELNLMVMLALSHGVKGILFKWFDSAWNTNHTEYWDCLVDENAVPRLDSLYYVVKDNLVPRLTGTLGKTLMDLVYSGDYLE